MEVPSPVDESLGEAGEEAGDEESGVAPSPLAYFAGGVLLQQRSHARYALWKLADDHLADAR